MRQPIALRPDYDWAPRHWLARERKDSDQVRRFITLAVIYDGGHLHRTWAMPMSDGVSRVGIITGVERRGRFTAEQKARGRRRDQPNLVTA